MRLQSLSFYLFFLYYMKHKHLSLMMMELQSDYGLHSLSQIPKETYISLLRGKNRENNVLAVTNEKLHAWSASCDSDLSRRNRK